MLLMMGRVVGKAYYCSMRFQQVRAYKGPAEAVLLFTFCLQRQYEYILRGLYIASCWSTWLDRPGQARVPFIWTSYCYGRYLLPLDACGCHAMRCHALSSVISHHHSPHDRRSRADGDQPCPRGRRLESASSSCARLMPGRASTSTSTDDMSV